MTEHELTLKDRIGIIRDTIAQIGEDKVALSFSGGKDSTIVHKLLDMAIPNNKIKRVFIDTGIEYAAIKKFVIELQASDNRFEIIKPSQPIKQMLEKNGYPFKSKQHAHNVSIYQKGGMSQTNINYLGMGGKTKFLCPSILRYQFSNSFNIKLSDKCCLKLKKEPFKKWKELNGVNCYISGMRRAEGGMRNDLNCVVKSGKDIIAFHPLAIVGDEWCDWFVKQFSIELCELYYPPYNFNRTGCKGCPFNINLQRELDTLAMYLPSEYAQCEAIWKPVYDEYRRIGYRLSNDITIFNAFNNK